MFGRLRHWADAGAVSAGLAFGVWAFPGYLPAVGPVALRFRPPPQPATNLVRMPLPPPDLPAPPPPAFATPPAATNTEAKLTPPATPSATPVLSTVASGPAGPEAVPSGSEPNISPQMLLRYFSRSTNGTASGITAPVNFAPPAAATPPSSTATYSTDPK